MSPPTTHPKPWRKTPLLHSAILSKHAGCQIYLKLESLQPSGSFKSRGIGNHMLTSLDALPDRSKAHFYIASGGNAGQACACAASSLGVPASIVVPTTTSAYMVSKLEAAGAQEVLVRGASWVDADAYVRDVMMGAASERGEVPIYVPAFDAQGVWDGHATLVAEVLEELGGCAPDVVVCSVGGGGLLSGIVQGLDGAGVAPTVLAVETKGADSLALSLERGELSSLESITSIANTLGARTVAARAFEVAQRPNVRSVVLGDREAMEGCVRFAEDERIMVEAACGVSLALCYEGRLREWVPELSEESKVVMVVCGGCNVNAGMLSGFAAQLEQYGR